MANIYVKIETADEEDLINMVEEVNHCIAIIEPIHGLKDSIVELILQRMRNMLVAKAH